jgi:hypothetical protein
VRLRTCGIETHIFRLKPAEHGFGYVGAAFEGRFAESGNARIGVDLDEHQVAPANGDFMNLEACDFDFSQRSRSLECRGQRNGGQMLNEGSSVHSAESYPTAKNALASSAQVFQSHLHGRQNSLIGSC